MPTKTRRYERVIFTPEVIKEAVDALINILPKSKRDLHTQILRIRLSPIEEWEHDNEEEFFSDYRKGFKTVHFYKKFNIMLGEISIVINETPDTNVTISMPSRADVEQVFNVFEANVGKCRLPKQPQTKSKIKTDWITEGINKIEGRCPLAGRKLKLALIKLDSEEAEEWQNATMLIRDAWIELTKWLCQVNNIDTSDIPPDAVIDMLRKLKIDETDDRLFNLARASFNLYAKHHKRNIDHDAAVACVISTVVSMQTVIREALNATS